ncbi:MAG: hypothetical protein Tsb005_16060 [Gammaproteobacteria bacterium]
MQKNLRKYEINSKKLLNILQKRWKKRRCTIMSVDFYNVYLNKLQALKTTGQN